VRSGQVICEEHTRYDFLADSNPGRTDDIGRTSKGRYQGAHFIAAGELDERIHLQQSEEGELRGHTFKFFTAPNGHEVEPLRPYVPADLIWLGLLKVVS